MYSATEKRWVRVVVARIEDDRVTLRYEGPRIRHAGHVGNPKPRAISARKGPSLTLTAYKSSTGRIPADPFDAWSPLAELSELAASARVCQARERRARWGTVTDSDLPGFSIDDAVLGFPGRPRNSIAPHESVARITANRLVSSSPRIAFPLESAARASSSLAVRQLHQIRNRLK